METLNRYCCRCLRTTRFAIELADNQGAPLTCSGCGVQIQVSKDRLGAARLRDLAERASH